MKLAIAALLGACALPATAHAYCKVQLPDGSWYYGDKCAQISRKGMPDDIVEQSAPAVLKELQESRDRDEHLQRQRLRGYEYRSTDRGGVRVREVEAVNQ